jgi:phosphoribosylglycinamide formyltransferase/phosphoribosylglycinamide formyltransferase-1
MIPMRVAVLASGSGTNLQALLDRCRGDAPARVALVVSNNPDARALQRARAANIPTVVLDRPSDGNALTKALQQHQADLVVLAGYMKLVPASTVEAFWGRMINLHPALLPAFGGKGMYGMHVHRAVLASGATISGVSVHLVTNEYDRGPVIAQWPVPVAADDTPESIAAKAHAVEHELLPAVVLASARAGRVVRLVPRGAAFTTHPEPSAIVDLLEPVEREQ